MQATLTDLGPAYVAAAAIIQYSLPRVKGGLPLDGSHDALGRTDYQAPSSGLSRGPSSLSLPPSPRLFCAARICITREQKLQSGFLRETKRLPLSSRRIIPALRSPAKSRYQLMRGDALFCKAETDRTAVSRPIGGRCTSVCIIYAVSFFFLISRLPRIVHVGLGLGLPIIPIPALCRK